MVGGESDDAGSNGGVTGGESPGTGEDEMIICSSLRIEGGCRRRRFEGFAVGSLEGSSSTLRSSSSSGISKSDGLCTSSTPPSPELGSSMSSWNCLGSP